VEADLSYFKTLVDGPWYNDDFLVLGQGDKVDENSFYKSPQAFLVAGGAR
jgi:hypothetical protein